MLSFPPIYSAPPIRQPSPLPRRSDSLSSTIAKPKPTSSLVQSQEDVKAAKAVLETPIIIQEDAHLDEEERERRHEKREQELFEVLGRMTGWVEELTSLLQQAYKNQTDLETALTLTRSNLQLALANNEMLEEALKRGGGQDIGWRRWSDREGVRRSNSVKEYVQHDRPNSIAEVSPQSHPQPSQQQQQQQHSAPSRFFNFKSPLQRISSTNTSPTSHTPTNSISPPYSHSASASASSLLPSISIPSTSSRSQSPARATSTPPSAANTASSMASTSSTNTPSPTLPSEREKELAALLEKERSALRAVTSEKTELEAELESLSQALFEEANKMVSKANRKLAETEEELRVATEQKEALKGALRIVEGENGELRGRSGRATPIVSEEDNAKRKLQWEREREKPPEARSVKDVKTLHFPPPRDVTPASAVTVAKSGQSESYWSPISPVPDTPLAATSSSPLPVPSPAGAPHPPSEPSPTKPSFSSAARHRWSVLPNSPHARSAVRSEFEEAMRRMQALVGEGSEAAPEEDGGVRELRVGATRSNGVSSESEVEAELTPRNANPWI